MKARAVMPRDKQANLKYNEKEQRWDYRVRLVRPDGTTFVRAGSAATESVARDRRNAAYKEFNNDLGAGKEEKKQKRKEGIGDLRSWTERVLPILRDDMAPTTYEAYAHALDNHVLPALGSLPLEDVRSLVISEHLQKLSREVSSGVASQARSALARVMQIAALDGRISGNPVTSVRVGARERKINRIERASNGDIGKRWLTIEEGKHLLAKTRGTASYFPILLGLRFGLRSGEAMGLTWAHIDLEAGVLKVRQQAQYVKGTPRHIAPPKSAAGIRDIPIPHNLKEELTTAKVKAEAEGVEWVCVDDKRAPLHPKHVTRLIKEAVTKAGFDGEDGKEIPTSNDFRSSYLSFLANLANGGSGVKPHVLMKIAGHADISMTMRFYVNAETADLAAAVNSLMF